jgi:hypothetical protein
MTTTLNAPVADGFDDDIGANRIIQGRVAKYDDPDWFVDGKPFDTTTKLLVIGVKRAAQLWENQRPVKTIVCTPDKEVDIVALNREIPSDEWEIGLDGKPREPWQLQYIVYLLDLHDGSQYTAINSTAGMRVAWEDLRLRVKNIRLIKRSSVVPIIRLSSAPFRTRFGLKERPEFAIIDWTSLGAPAPSRQIAYAANDDRDDRIDDGDPGPDDCDIVGAADIIDDDIPF